MRQPWKPHKGTTCSKSTGMLSQAEYGSGADVGGSGKVVPGGEEVTLIGMEIIQ
jgi:hypothetical protein